MDFLNWANSRTLPKALQTRSGWADFFEYHRNDEPHVHQIEPTNHCQYACIMCPREKRMVRPTGYMEMDLFKKIIDEIAAYSNPVKEIELFHFGESLLHKQLIQMTSYTTEARLRPVLSINPALLTQDQIENLPLAKPAKLIISIDSLKPERFKAIRGRQADLATAIKKTEAILENCKKHSTNVIIRMIVMHINEDETENYKAFWQERGAAVELREFFPWNEISFSKLGNYQKYPPKMPCPFPWQHVVIHWNGDVVPCCRDYNSKIVLGNVKNKTLKEIWSSGEYQLFRDRMKHGTQLSDICNDCLSLYYKNS